MNLEVLNAHMLESYLGTRTLGFMVKSYPFRGYGRLLAGVDLTVVLGLDKEMRVSDQKFIKFPS